jgi:hypothetical protein
MKIQYMPKIITYIIKKICENCNKAFFVTNKKRNIKKRFCCRWCSAHANGKNNKGRKHSEYTKKLLSEINKGENNAFYGKKHSNKTKNIISDKNKWDKTEFNYCILTENEQDILNGILLGDGHIEKLKFTSRLSYGSKFKETLQDIKNCLKTFNFSPLWQSQITKCWHIKSKSYLNLNEIKNKWYKNNIKIVPIDIKLTPLSLYWWFTGDGYRKNYGIIFCTDAFNLNDKLILITKLNEIGFSSARLTKTQKRILIGGCEVKKFLNYIKNNVNISHQYQYKFSNKWKIKKEKNEK